MDVNRWHLTRWGYVCQCYSINWWLRWLLWSLSGVHGKARCLELLWLAKHGACGNFHATCKTAFAVAFLPSRWKVTSRTVPAPICHAHSGTQAALRDRPLHLRQGVLPRLTFIPPATQAFGGSDYSFLSTTTSTPDSVHSVKKDLSQQQGTPPTQQSTPTTSMKKKRSVVNLFSYNNISELLSNQQQSSPSNSSQQPSMQTQPPASQVQQSICDTNTVSSKRYSAFNNISFDTNLDFLSFVSLYRSFRWVIQTKVKFCVCHNLARTQNPLDIHKLN